MCTTTRSEVVPSSLDFFIKFAFSSLDKWLSYYEPRYDCFNYIQFPNLSSFMSPKLRYLSGLSPAVTSWSGIRGSSLTQEKTHVKTFRVDIPFSFAVLQSSLLVPNRSELDRVRSQALAHQIKRVVATQASAATKVCFKDIWTWACHWKLFERGVGKCLIEK